MRPRRGLRIGISALILEGAADHRRAGVALSCLQLIDNLIALPTEHEFVVFLHPAFEPPEAWRTNPRVRLVTPRAKWHRHLRRWEHLAATILTVRFRLNVWFSPHGAMPLVVWTKRVLLVHDLFVLTNPELFTPDMTDYPVMLVRRAVAKAERVLANSEFTKREIERLFDLPSARVTVLSFGPGHRLGPIGGPLKSASALGMPFDRFFFALGTLEPRKNVPAILRAVDGIRAQLESAGCGVAIAGARGWKSAAIEEMHAELKLERLVHFMGYVADEDLPHLFGGCEAFICASFSEGFGLPVLEAHQAGAPVICSTGGSLPEVAGPAARMFDPNDPGALALEMLGMLEHPERRDELARAGRAFARRFDWATCARLTLSAMEEVA